MKLSIGLAFSMGLLVLHTCQPAEAQVRRTCAGLSSLQWGDGRVTSAQLVAAPRFKPGGRVTAAAGGSGTSRPASGSYSDLPAFCQVIGEVRTSATTRIHFEVWLPESRWNGNFRADGFAFFGGTMDPAALAAAVREGYATATTDAGGDGTSGASFLLNPEALKDWNYRAWHETTIKAKALIAAYYGRGPRFSYWNLTGGATRQGLKNISMYPDDYDGIAAGGITNYDTRFVFAQMAAWQATHDTPDSYFDARSLQILNAGVLAECDMDDGVKDGLLHDPRDCHFDPKALMCRQPQQRECLTRGQVQAVEKLYSPVRNSRTGEELYPRLLPGGDWNPALLNTSPELPPGDFAANFFKYIVFADPNLDWHSKRVNYDTDVALADRPAVSALNAIDTNLQPFVRRGGKIFLYNGWNDNMSPLWPIEYYRRLTEGLGDDTHGSVRLFMIPGMGHNPANGARPYDPKYPPADGYSFDPMPLLVRWRESGQPPEQFIVDHRNNGRLDRTLLVCSFPRRADYRGAGDPLQGASYHCVQPH